MDVQEDEPGRDQPDGRPGRPTAVVARHRESGRPDQAVRHRCLHDVIQPAAGWATTDGAYLDLGDVVDTVRVKVNGESVLVNQADKSRIDLGGHLRAGTNELEVRVATTLFNAVKTSGDSNYQMPALQRTGLMGPITVTPYRDVALVGKVTPPAAAKKATRTSFKLSRATYRKGGRPTVSIVVTADRKVSGVVEVRVDGRRRHVAKVVNGRAKVKLTSKIGRGRHKVQVVFRANGTFKGSKSPPGTSESSDVIWVVRVGAPPRCELRRSAEERGARASRRASRDPRATVARGLARTPT
ncbi:hypothetical protein [Aeromicrobium sp. UC242_57]|uniref:hypothetical protein n=1 Tax=Aeromicrobium sp. UC242_57 TaxID=3374624 RepID=UPI00378DCC3E